jgi:hypothetical protein
MKTFLKRALTFAVGLCWLGFGTAIGFFLLQYLSAGAGRQVLGISLSTMNVALGVVHFAGFCAGAIICLAFGLFMCASSVAGGLSEAADAVSNDGEMLRC